MAPKKLTYDVVEETFGKQGAHLQITKTEFAKIIKPSLHSFDIIASCGHARKCRVNHILHDNIICLKCTKQKAIEKQIETHKSSQHNFGYQLEYDSYVFIKGLINNIFDIIKLPEGTKADLLIKPKNSIDDLWCQIQLKATKAPARKNQYNFNLRKQYHSMVVICHCLEDKKLWVIPGNLLTEYKHITLCDKSNTKYEKYKCDNQSLAKQLLTCYHDESITKIDNMSAYIDVSMNVSKEHQYRLLREKKLPFIDFRYNEMDGLVYDFQINRHKVQEKYNNHTTDNPNRFNFHLNKYGGHINNRSIECPYEQNDNDFYWFHIPGDKLFYVIPEIELLKHGFIKSENHKGKKSIILHPLCSFEDLTLRNIKTAFANKYLFDYDNPDIETLSSMFTTEVV